MIDFQEIESIVYQDGKYCSGELGGCGECAYRKTISHESEGRAIYSVSEVICEADGDCMTVDREWTKAQDEIVLLSTLSGFIDAETEHDEDVENNLKSYMLDQLLLMHSGLLNDDGSTFTINDFFDDLALAIAEIRINKAIAEQKEKSILKGWAS